MEEEGDHITVYVNGQASSGQPKASQQQHSFLKVTVTDKVQDQSPGVVVKKTVSLKTQSVIVNGVPLKNKQSIEDTVTDSPELEDVLDPPEGGGKDALGAKEPIEEAREAIQEAPPEIIEKRPLSLHMEHVFNEEGRTELREPIEEASAIAVESEPISRDYHPMLEEAEEDETVDSDPVEVEYEPAAKKPKEEETETDTRDTIAEEFPQIVEKRPVSLNMEHVFNDEESTEVREPIEEVSANAVESEPRFCEYHPMLEEAKDDENVNENVDGMVEVEYEPAPKKIKEQETETETREAIAEESPQVVEKRPVLLNMEVVPDHKKDDREPVEEAPHEVIEKRPAFLHMEQMFYEGGRTELREPIEEASATAVESGPRFCVYHPMLEEAVEDTNVDRNDDGNSVEVECEPTATTPKEEETEKETRETIAEESPQVVEKRPASLHMEVVFDHKEEDRQPVEEAPHEIVEKRPVLLHMEHVFNEEGSTEVREPEPIEEASATAVESEPRFCDYHSMLEEAAEDKNVDENVDGNSVEVEYEPAARKSKDEETETETRETIAEESPQVVEKRPVSLHMEVVFDYKEDDRQPVEEVQQEVVEKRPVSFHVEHVFNEEGSTEVQEPIEEASATALESRPRFCDYHPMLEEAVEDKNVDENVDGNSVEVEYEPAATKPKGEKTITETREAIAEESPQVVEKRPASLHTEVVFDHNEKDRQPVEEAPHEIVEKRLVSLHVEHVFNKGGSTEVRQEVEETSTVASKSEPRFYDYHPMLEEKEEDANDDENSVEVEYKPAATKPKEEETETEIRKGTGEEPPLVGEKRPVSLHMEHVFKEEGRTEVREPIVEYSAVAAESEPKLFHSHPMLEETTEDKDVDGNNVEVEYVPVGSKTENEQETETETRQTIAEQAPQVVEKRPASFHMERVFDHEEDKPVPQDNEEVVHEVVTDVVERKPVLVAWYGEQPKENEENELESEEEPSSVDVLEIPEVEKKKEIEDSVQETVKPAVEKSLPEFHHELLQTVETEGQKSEDTAKEIDVEEMQETEILDDDVRGSVQEHDQTQQETYRTEVVTTRIAINQTTNEDQTTQEEVVQTIYEKKTVEMTTESTSSVPDTTTTTTEETVRSSSFTRLIPHGDRDDDEELLRRVLRKRLSAPEVLPEKESDGSAPLAASEDRGILESQEQFAFEQNSRKKDATPTKSQEVPGDASSGKEPYEDVPDEEKLIPDASGEAEVGDADKTPEESADDTKPVLLLFTPEEEDKSEPEKGRKKGGKGGLSSPQCKCCSLM